MHEKWKDQSLWGNQVIDEKIHLLYEEQKFERFVETCETIRMRIAENGHFLFPAEAEVNEEGNTVHHYHTVETETGTMLAAFTTAKRSEFAPKTGLVSLEIGFMLEILLQMDGIAGLVLNPWSEPLFLDQDDLALILGKQQES